MIFENIDTLVLCQGHQPVDTLAEQIRDLVEVQRIGDCLAPRTAEEAIHEGLKVAAALSLFILRDFAGPTGNRHESPHCQSAATCRGRQPRAAVSRHAHSRPAQAPRHDPGRAGRTEELTAGYISQLERNLSYPSIPALFNIARSLGVTIQWFFASEAVTAPEDEGYVVRRNSRLSVHYEDGIVDQLLTPQPSAQLEMLHSRFPRAPTASKATATTAKKPATCCAGPSSCGSASATSS
jgi:transcriptional regulator with XRE-family HTH domain